MCNGLQWHQGNIHWYLFSALRLMFDSYLFKKYNYYVMNDFSITELKYTVVHQ